MRSDIILPKKIVVPHITQIVWILSMKYEVTIVCSHIGNPANETWKNINLKVDFLDL